MLSHVRVPFKIYLGAFRVAPRKEVEFVSPGPSGQSMTGTFRLTCEHLNEDCSGMCAQCLGWTFGSFKG